MGPQTVLISYKPNFPRKEELLCHSEPSDIVYIGSQNTYKQKKQKPNQINKLLKQKQQQIIFKTNHEIKNEIKLKDKSNPKSSSVEKELETLPSTTPTNSLGTIKKPDSKKRHINILSWNAQSLNSREKQLFVSASNQNQDILCIQETWGANSDGLIRDKPNIKTCFTSRNDRRGGGTVTVLNNEIRIVKTHPINEDSKLLRLVLHQNKILWLCNIYLNRGCKQQIQKLFRVIRDEIPKEEWNRVVIVGDLNVNLMNSNDEKVKLLKALAREFGLELLEPNSPTRGEAKIDFALVSKDLKGCLRVIDIKLSDHRPIALSIEPSFVNKGYRKICLPNSRLAKTITIQSLILSKNSNEWILRHHGFREKNIKRAWKRIQKKDYEKKLLSNLLEKKDAPIIQIIKDYWNDLLHENEKLRYGQDTALAFQQLKRIFGYHKFEKRDGAIVDAILKDGEILTDVDQINSTIIQALKKLQVDETRLTPHAEPFPDMPDLSLEEAVSLVRRMSTNKAIAFDLFSDAVFEPQFEEKTAHIIRDLWSKKNLDNLVNTNFEARLIPLNKKFPEIPKPDEFRPIVIMSALVKLLESRTLGSLQNYQVTRMHRSQTGFVPTLDIFVNIHRTMNRLKMRLNNKKPAFCLFLDFKSAYNTVPHDKLLQKLNHICTMDEVQLIRAIYSRLTIKLGKEIITCNTGVAQGSMISPALFDIYAEELLEIMESEGWDLEDLLAYADDHLVICDTIDEIRKAIQVVQDWCREANISLNANKSGILEVLHRRGKPLLQIGECIEGIPVVQSYKYLGLFIDNKLTGDAHLRAMNQKIGFLTTRLAPLLSKISTTYRVNLWKILIQPLFKPLLAIIGDNNQTRIKKVELQLKGSLKRFTRLSRNTKDEVVERLSRFDVTNLAKEQRDIAVKKWELWCRGEIKEWARGPSPKSPLLPGNFTTYNNIQNLGCGKCSKARLHPRHLKEAHGIIVPSTIELMDELKMLQAEKKLDRKQLKEIEEYVQEYISTILTMH